MTSRIAIVAGICAIVAGGVWAIDRMRNRPPDRPATYPVAGTLLVNGIPAANANIAFHPLGEHSEKLYRPVGSTRKDGSFSLMTYALDDGAPEGDYAVTVLWIDPTQPYDDCGDMTIHDVLKGRYLDARHSKLRARIVRGSNEIRILADNPGSWTAARLRDLESAQR